MRSSGGYSNQDSGQIDIIVADLCQMLASPDTRAGLEVVAKKLAAVRADGRPRPIKSRRIRRHRPGWILDQVVAVMADHAKPMRAIEVHAAIEARLGETVSKDSVNSCLLTKASGEAPLFIRLARGRYGRPPAP